MDEVGEQPVAIVAAEFLEDVTVPEEPAKVFSLE